MFNLKNREFTFTVDVSELPCGLNGALYFVEMDKDGGMSRFPGNAAGAKYGTGYCDAQCPQDVKFLNGQANTINWDSTNSQGQFGSCCIELDLWEANSISSAYTPHPCSITGQYRCNGTECGAGSLRYSGVCDKDGCDFNSYRMGATSFYGPGLTVDTNKPITVVTQFLTDTGGDNGVLSEIRRIYLQDGKQISNSMGMWPGLTSYDSITNQMCKDIKETFGDTDDFTPNGGLKAMGEALDRGMVLVMSLWTDSYSNMLWLDSLSPTTGSPSTPGVARGSCATTSGVASEVISTAASATVKFSEVKWGTIGSTYTTDSTASSTSAPDKSTDPVATSAQIPGPTTPPTSDSTSAPTSAPIVTETNAGVGRCKADLAEELGSTWPTDAGLVRLSISNTGTMPIKSAQIAIVAPGTVSSVFGLDVVEANQLYALPAWAVPIADGDSSSMSGFVYNNGRPTVTLTVSCA